MIERYAAYVRETSPFTRVLGLARSLLAASTLLTLVATPRGALFLQSDLSPAGPGCGGVVRRLNLYCLGHSPTWTDIAACISVIILVMVIVGVAPAITAIPHWYVSWSAATSFGLVDGGDHINAMLTAIVVPILLCDRRWSHWQIDKTYHERHDAVRAVAHLGLAVVTLQMVALYLIASTAKLNVPEWADGTALWYWLSDPVFGLPPRLFSFLAPALSNLLVSAVLTFGVMAVELAAAASVLFPARWRHRVLVLMLMFHLTIAVVMGLWSFGLSMAGGLLLFLVRPGETALDAFARKKRPRPTTAGNAAERSVPERATIQNRTHEWTRP